MPPSKRVSVDLAPPERVYNGAVVCSTFTLGRAAFTRATAC
jgi:hypothetical protein